MQRHYPSIHSSIIHPSTQTQSEHSATFSEKLIKPFILGTSKEVDTILDPFLGSGTTAKVSLDNGRKCIGYEISPVFVDTSYQRCAELKYMESSKAV
jgi:DNA modification methylase